jgi:hypothetical protein
MTLIQSPKEYAFCYLIGADKKHALLRYKPETDYLSPPGGYIDYEKYKGPEDAMGALFHEQTGYLLPLPLRYAAIDNRDREGNNVRHYFFRGRVTEEVAQYIAVPEGQLGLEWVDMGRLFYIHTDPYTQFMLPMAFQMGNIEEQRFEIVTRYGGFSSVDVRWLDSRGIEKTQSKYVAYPCERDQAVMLREIVERVGISCLTHFFNDRPGAIFVIGPIANVERLRFENEMRKLGMTPISYVADASNKAYNACFQGYYLYRSEK